MTTLWQWTGLFGIFACVAGIYYLAKWFEGLAEKGARTKERRVTREERRKKMKERLEDKLWLQKERAKIMKELEKDESP